jgi:hypothetical protein
MPHFPPISRCLVRFDVKQVYNTAQHNGIRKENPAFENFYREALLSHACCRLHSTSSYNSGYAADLRSLVTFSTEKTANNVHNHFRKWTRCWTYERSALAKLAVFSSDAVSSELCFCLFSLLGNHENLFNFIFPQPCEMPSVDSHLESRGLGRGETIIISNCVCTSEGTLYLSWQTMSWGVISHAL